jgi:hypothetical protein
MEESELGFSSGFVRPDLCHAHGVAMIVSASNHHRLEALDLRSGRGPEACLAGTDHPADRRGARHPRHHDPFGHVEDNRQMLAGVICGGRD